MTGTAIIGGGPAGSAAAIALARAGHRPLLLERDAVPREVVCGEFLGPDAAVALRRLGLEPGALGAVPLRGLRLGVGRREVALELPFAAWALPRRTLDAALRAAAVQAGAMLATGVAVQGAEQQDGQWRVRTAAAEHAARRLVLATGKHALRGHPRPGARGGALGLKLHLHGVTLGPEVVLLACGGGYAGLLPNGDGSANLCAALHDPPADAARSAETFLAHVAAGSALGARLLGGARPDWSRPLAVAAIPYGFRTPVAGPAAFYRVGDQASVIPSFTGDGVAMALASGLAAAEAILADAGAPAFHAAWRERVAGPMRWAGLGAWLLRNAPPAFLAAASVPILPRVLALRTRVA